jgi:ribosomal protein L16 Arg81 hydroxylase
VLDISKGLGAILSPVSRELFLKEHWEEKPLLIQRRARSFYDGLFSTQDLDQLISYSEMGYPMLRAVQKGKPEQSLNFVRDPFSPEKPLTAQIKAAYKLYADGYTIVVNGLEWRSQPVRQLCRYLEAELSHPVGVNAYATPRGSQGFSVHFDDHDVIILQIDGTKHWEIYPPDTLLPLEEKASEFKPTADAQLPKPHLTAALEPGDLLYLPRGWTHAARSSEASSLHLTVGIFVYRWADFIQQALHDVSVQDVRFRRALPPGFLNDGTQSDSLRANLEQLMGALHKQVDASGARNGMARHLLKRSEPTPEGRLGELNALPDLNLDTELVKPAAMRCTVFADGGSCTFHFNGTDLRLPAKTAEALKFLSEHDGAFTGRQVPGPLRESEVLVLLRRMIKEGLLRRTAPKAAS